MTARYASAVDAGSHGTYRPTQLSGPAFTGRLDPSPGAEFPAVAGRYHLYLSRTRPQCHRLELICALSGAGELISRSYVDSVRDGRGWAFRPASGPDPINGFTLLRQAYLAGDPGFRGDASVPMLWDVERGTVVSNDAASIGYDLAEAFAAGSGRRLDLAPAAVREQVQRLSGWVTGTLPALVAGAVRDAESAYLLRAELRRLDARLSGRDHLVGDVLTDADLQLWVQLVRLDAGPNAFGTIGPSLDAYPNLWRYALRLYREPAFATTTDFSAFAAPLAQLPPWSSAA